MLAQKRNKIQIILLIILVLITGYFREYLFKTLNLIIDYGENQEVKNLLQGAWASIADWEEGNLILLKWIMTIVFTSAFLWINLMFAKVLFQTKKYNTIIILIYSGIFLLAAFSIVIGKLIPSIYSDCFYFSRWMMGAVQSPLLTALICLIIFYSNQNSSQKTN